MRKIKEIRAEMDQLREEYQARIRMLEEEIVAVRDRRGYVPVMPVYEDHFEPGRSAEPGPR